MTGEQCGGYRLLQPIGEGGMGTVYLAEHVLLGREAAVKVLLPTIGANDRALRRFFTEARAAALINHPGIVTVFDFGVRPDRVAYIVLEFLDGESLGTRLRKRGVLEAREAMELTCAIARPLAAAHDLGVVHRDLKPDNVFLARDPECGERVKILDFGIAKLLGDDQAVLRTPPDAVLGTPKYMAPEQCGGGAEIGPATDIYALGCMLYHMLVGAAPFVGSIPEIVAAHRSAFPTPPSSKRNGISRELDELVLRMLAKDPRERPPSMDALLAELEAISAIPRPLVVRNDRVDPACETTAPEQVPSGDVTMPIRPRRQRRIMAAVLAGLVAGMLVSQLLRGHANRDRDGSPPILDRQASPKPIIDVTDGDS